MINARTFVRLIGQYLWTTRDLSLYLPSVRPNFNPKDAGLSVSGLFAYKLNWQTVFYVGYGGDDAYSNSTQQMEKNHQQAFIKISYAWQH
jgi:hypothetical protein